MLICTKASKRRSSLYSYNPPHFSLTNSTYPSSSLENYYLPPTNNLQHPPHQRPIHLIQPLYQYGLVPLPIPNPPHRLTNMTPLCLQLTQHLFNLTPVAVISTRHHR